MINKLFREQQKARSFQNELMKRKKGQGQGPDAINPIVYLDISRDNESIGRITFELFESIEPKTVDNFRSIVSGENN